MKRLGIVLAALLLFEVMYFFYAETNDVVLSVREIPDPVLARVFGESRLVHISDLHVKGLGDRERRLLSIVDELDPEIVFVTGDLISGDRGIAPCGELMRRMSRGRTVISSFGNNDHSFGTEEVDTERLARALRAAGVQLLRNESAKLTVTGSGRERGELYVVGLDDNFLWFDDIYRAMNNVPPASPKILLAHAPNIVEKIETSGINLVLSGHTHGGQIRLPFRGPLYLNPVFRTRKKLVAGLYCEEGTKVYVSRGIGTALMPIRFLCKPQVTLIRFVDEKRKGGGG